MGLLTLALAACQAADNRQDEQQAAADIEALEERVAELESDLRRAVDRAEAAETRADRAEQETESLSDQLATAQDELALVEAGPMAEAETAAVDEPVTDMGLRFLVTDVQCLNGFRFDALWEEDEPEEVMAQGQFCQVFLQIENVGDEPQWFYGHSTALIDSQGRSHHQDDVTIDVNFTEDGDTAYGEELNPGQAGDLILVFDIPRDVTPEELLVVVDEWDSPGAAVELPDPEWTGRGDPDW